MHLVIASFGCCTTEMLWMKCYKVWAKLKAHLFHRVNIKWVHRCTVDWGRCACYLTLSKLIFYSSFIHFTRPLKIIIILIQRKFGFQNTVRWSLLKLWQKMSQIKQFFMRSPVFVNCSNYVQFFLDWPLLTKMLQK